VKPYYEDAKAGIVIYHGDCREVLPTLTGIDVVVTDPPYGLGDKWGDGRLGWSSPGIRGHGKLWRGTPEWDRYTSDAAVGNIIGLDVPTVIWGGNYYDLPPTNAWLIWDKIQKHTGSEAELAWSNLSQPVRVFRMSRLEAYCGRDGKQHPNQKPLALLKWCLKFLPNAETVLDPFMGSGTTLRAAKDLGRKAIGIEIEERYCEIAANRLRQEVLF